MHQVPLKYLLSSCAPAPINVSALPFHKLYFRCSEMFRGQFLKLRMERTSPVENGDVFHLTSLKISFILVEGCHQSPER